MSSARSLPRPIGPLAGDSTSLERGDESDDEYEADDYGTPQGRGTGLVAAGCHTTGFATPLDRV